jgi:type IV pilus assembly protein PilA
MNMNDSSSIQGQTDGEQDNKGFTLIEILIAIVLVGILSAVAVVGISNLVGKGGTSACQASADSAKAASAVYFASNNAYPADFFALTNPATVNGPPMTLPTGVIAATGTTPFAIVAGILSVKSGTAWTLTMTPGTGGVAPTFACT